MSEPENKTEKVPESKAMAIFRVKAELAMARIETLEDFRKSDSMVDFVFKIGREMFDKPLDNMATEWLINTGGKLTAVYAYLGNKASYTRARRDVYEQKRDEVMARISLEEYPDTEKITVAKAKAKLQITELDEMVTIAESEKNNMESLTNACQTMIMFIQSCIKIKQTELMTANRTYDEKDR